MIPNKFKKTNKLIQELSKLKEIEEMNILKLQDPDLADQIEANESFREVYEEEPEVQYEKQINESFKDEYKLLDDSKTYFLGCSHNTYVETYESRLEAFKKTYKDGQEYNFIYDELEALTFYNLPYYIDSNFQKSIRYSLERTKEYLISKLEELGFTVKFTTNKTGLTTLLITTDQKSMAIKKVENSKLSWTKGNTGLVELAKALYNSKCIENITQKEFFEQFFDFFNNPIEEPYSVLTKIVDRKEPLKLIPLLEYSLQTWIENRPQNNDEI